MHTFTNPEKHGLIKPFSQRQIEGLQANKSQLRSQTKRMKEKIQISFVIAPLTTD